MEKLSCTSCLKPKATLKCGLCGVDLCKACARALDDFDFSYLVPLPADFAHPFYCTGCFDDKVQSALSDYMEVVERAKEVLVFMKDQGKETRLIKRKEAPLRVEECDDYDETIMRLAFQAAKAGHNAIVDVAITSRKVKDGSYQTTKYEGRANPVTVDPQRYDSDRPKLSNPN